MRTIPVCRSEFGLKLFYHVPQVHTLCLSEPCIVEIEQGEEALYPAAAEWRIVERGCDNDRPGRPKDLECEPTRFVPEPYVSYGISPDIVVCPRKREYGSQKNWPHWARLTSMLRIRGAQVFAGGAPDSSDDVPCALAWERPRFLDATIEAIRSAKLVIATDAGLAHLAILCGAPLLLITYEGLVAPGPVVNSSGKKVWGQYWKAGWSPPETVDRFAEGNHTGSPVWRIDDAWDDPYKVACRAMDLAAERAA